MAGPFSLSNAGALTVELNTESFDSGHYPNEENIVEKVNSITNTSLFILFNLDCVVIFLVYNSMSKIVNCFYVRFYSFVEADGEVGGNLGREENVIGC